MNHKAFTLIELLVVVAIIGILAAVGVVAYNGYTSSAKKAVTKANHKIILNTMVSQIQMCEVDSSLGLLDNKLNCSDIFTLTNNYGKVTSTMSSYFGSIIENAYSSSIPATHEDDIKEHVFQVDLSQKDGVVLTNKVSIMLQWVG